MVSAPYVATEGVILYGGKLCVHCSSVRFFTWLLKVAEGFAFRRRSGSLPAWLAPTHQSKPACRVRALFLRGDSPTQGQTRFAVGDGVRGASR